MWCTAGFHIGFIYFIYFYILYIILYILLISYVNDIVNTSSVLEFVLFADDTTILYSQEDIESKIDVINLELKDVKYWFKANRLSVNANKTNYMLLGTRQRYLKQDDNTFIELDNTVEREFLRLNS